MIQRCVGTLCAVARMSRLGLLKLEQAESIAIFSHPIADKLTRLVDLDEIDIPKFRTCVVGTPGA